MRFRRKRPSDAGEGGVLEAAVPSLQEMISPDGLEEMPDRLLVGPSRYSRVFALAVWPRGVWLSWLDDIYSVGEVDFSVYVEPIPDRRVVGNLTRRVVGAEAQRMVDVKRGVITRLPELTRAVQDMEALRDAVQTNRDRVFFATVLIVVHAESEEALESRCARLENILARKATQVRALLFQQADGLAGALALARQRTCGFERSLSTGGLQAMLPVTSTGFTHPSGVFLGHAPDGTLVFYDAFIGPPRLPNPHMAVFGPPGAGKSVTLKVYGGRLVLSGTKVLFFDLEREYQGMVRNLCDGQVVAVSPGRASGINPLDMEAEVDPDTGAATVNVLDKVADVRALLGTAVQYFAGRPMSAREVSLLEEAIREEYASRDITSDPESLYEPGGRRGTGWAVGRVKKRMPTLSDLHSRLASKPGLEELATVLRVFLRGGSLGMFDCETAVDVEAPAVVFDLFDVKDEFARFYSVFVTMAWAWHRFVLRQEGKKAIVIDEGWMFARYPAAAHFLEIFARRGRKRRLSLVVASQFVEEFLSREEGRAIVGSCESLMLMRQSPAVLPQVVEAFNLTSGAAEFLSQAGPGECLLRAGDAFSALYVQPLDCEWPYVTTGASGAGAPPG